ncbi:lipocalin family protein [Pricia sp. S334]|uniref:Lipocalin family protein n=1 Tax=Pricia mediterranea TaxID=3076079 RepID=A0ABU3LA02_9FLAO|nr:lipocalin family protein [Pricia sp. S334]MDT7830571.1 lipocalin family protein [Pricia sp. S334]
MIRNSIVLFAASLLMFSCSTSKQVRNDRKMVDGTWTLDNVGYEGSEGDFKAQLFDDASAVCFEGSTWFFRNNNSTGNYTIQPGSLCSGGQRNIRWSIIENQGGGEQLQFKYIDEKKNDIYGKQGYRLDVVSLAPSQMTLKSNVTVEGDPVSVIYEFSRQ